MYEKIRDSKEKVTIAALAPLTNIALLLRSHPEIKSKIEMICLMGGGIHTGNRTAAAEFNIYVDPEASKIVFNSGVDIVMAGLDVTNTAMIMDDERELLRGKGKISDFVSQLLDFYSIASKRFGFEGSSLHDPCVIGYLLRPDLFSGRKYHVDIETQGELTRGMTLADERPVPENGPNALVLLEVKRKEFIDFVCQCMSKLDAVRG
jgi:pyrimidine-specific ribonucleoside hydrolase